MRLFDVLRKGYNARQPRDKDGQFASTGGGGGGGGSGSGSNPFAGRHKAGAIESAWSPELGRSLAYAVPSTSDAKRGANSNNPWRHTGASDRAKLELIASKNTKFSDGFKSQGSDSKDFKDHSKSEVRSLLTAAYKAGGGKSLDDATADSIASKFSPFKTLRVENSDRADFAEVGRASMMQLAAAAFLRGKASRKG
jgi:hypothetical protein